MTGPSKKTMAHWASLRKQSGKTPLSLDRVHTGSLIERVRMLRGLTQQQMADLVGFTQKHISVLERNPTCSVSTLQQIADGLELDLVIDFKEKR